LCKKICFLGVILKVNDENSRICIQDPDPNPDSLVRGMDLLNRIRIQDPDPQHWFLLYFFLNKFLLTFPVIKLDVFLQDEFSWIFEFLTKQGTMGPTTGQFSSVKMILSSRPWTTSYRMKNAAPTFMYRKQFMFIFWYCPKVVFDSVLKLFLIVFYFKKDDIHTENLVK